MSEKPQRLIWIDLEMTGLDPKVDHILEIATLVTDEQLTIVAEGPVLTIHQPDEILTQMNEWCIQQHNASGLVKRVQESCITAQEAEQATLLFLQQYVKTGESPMCGNSVHQDRRFLYEHMPTLADFFHYRHLDVSALKVVNQCWQITPKFEKQSTHMAMDDIKASIAELTYYREHLLRST